MKPPVIALLLVLTVRAIADPIPRVVAGRDAASLAERGASRIERRTARIGLRTVSLPVRALAPRVMRRPNLCVNRTRVGFPRPASNSCEPSYGDCVWAAIDGVPWEGDYEWSSDYTRPAVPWYQVDFGRVQRVGEVRVWLRRGYPMRDFDVLVQDRAGAWRAVARVRGNRNE